MARQSSKSEQKQLGFNMGMDLPNVLSPKDRLALHSSKEISVAQTPEQHSKDAEEGLELPALEGPTILSVAELTNRITHLLEAGIGMIWVEGEVSNLRRQASGHIYFTLKDESAQLSCVLFARTSAGVEKLALRDGLQLQLYGQLSVYKPRGQYQLMVRIVQPKGEGVLQARFEELKRRLNAEGLFDQERKRPLPRFPRRIGVVTSPTGAAIRDFLDVLHRRHPGLRVIISPVRVQGKGAASEIATAIAEFSSASAQIGPIDVIVLTRGGGSLEDLWEFNEEVVARAIAVSSIPVVSAVGHEIDFCIADFVADLRAPTPSAAAELLAADGAELMKRCRALVARIGREATVVIDRHRAEEYRLSMTTLFREPLRRLNEARQTSDQIECEIIGVIEHRMEQRRSSLTSLTARLAAAHPGRQLVRERQQLAALHDQINTLVRHRIQLDQGLISRFQATLSALSPKATLARGFSITRNVEGRVVTSEALVKSGEQLQTQLADGSIISKVL